MNEDSIPTVILITIIFMLSCLIVLTSSRSDKQLECLEYTGTPDYAVAKGTLYCKHADGNYVKLRVGNK